MHNQTNNNGMRLSCPPPYAMSFPWGNPPWCSPPIRFNNMMESGAPLTMVPWIPPWCPPQPWEPWNPDGPGPWISKNREEDFSGFQNMFGSLSWSSYNYLVTQLSNELEIIHSIVDKEMEGRTFPNIESEIELSSFIISSYNEMIPKILNSEEGQRIIKEISQHITSSFGVNPSFRVVGAFLAGVAIGAAATAIGAAAGYYLCKKTCLQ